MSEKKAKDKRASGKPKASAGGQRAASRSTASRTTSKKVAPPAKKKPAVKTKAKRAATPSIPPPRKLDVTELRRESAKKTALAIALAALDKKAQRVEIVDIGEKVDYADYLVVMTGSSDRQVVAIAKGIQEALKNAGTKTVGLEGLPEGQWVLIDFSDVIVHVFLDEARKYYDLEGLWMDAPRVPTPSFTPPSPISDSYSHEG